MIAELSGDLDCALQHYQKATELKPNDEDAHATLRRIFEVEPNDGLALYNCSCAYALLGEESEARISLRRAFESGFKTVAHWARTDSAFDSMRSQPEFQQLLAELQ